MTEELRAVEYRNGRAIRYEVVHTAAAQPPAPPVRQPYIIGHDDRPPVAYQQPTYEISGTPVDEAKAFTLKVVPLSLSLSLATVIAGVALTSWGLWTLLAYFVGVNALTWFAAFVFDALRSPGGVQLFHAWQQWRFIRREQDHRHRGNQ